MGVRVWFGAPSKIYINHNSHVAHMSVMGQMTWFLPQYGRGEQ